MPNILNKGIKLREYSLKKSLFHINYKPVEDGYFKSSKNLPQSKRASVGFSPETKST